MRIDVNTMAAAKVQFEDWVVCEFDSGKGSEIASGADYSAIYSAATQNGAPSTIMVNPDDFTTTGEISVDGEFDFIPLDVVARSDERCVGKECVSTFRSRGWSYH